MDGAKSGWCDQPLSHGGGGHPNYHGAPTRRGSGDFRIGSS